MTLQRKTLFIFGLSSLCLLLTLLLASWYVFQGNVAGAEKAEAERTLRASRGLLAQMVDQFDQRFADWSAWDDAYDFVQTRNPRFTQSNLNDETLVSLQVSAILFVDTQGRIVFGTGFDDVTTNKTPVPMPLVHLLKLMPQLRRFAQLNSSHSGLLAVNGRLMMLSMRPIVTSKQQGPVRGTLVVGRYLDTKQMHRLADWGGVSLSLRPLTEGTLSPQTQKVYSSLRRVAEKSDTIQPSTVRPSVVTHAIDAETLSAYTLLPDIKGNSTLLLQASIPRQSYLKGLQSLRYLLGALALSALVFSAVTLGLLRRLVLAPLTQLSREVRHIRDKGDMTSRVALSGDHDLTSAGELTNLAHDINAMLSTLEETQRSVRESEERFRSATQYAAIGVALVSPSGRFLQANRSLCRLLGYDEPELLAMTFQDLTHPGDLNADVESVQQLLAGRIQTYQMEKRYRHRDGHAVWTLLSVSLVRDEAGQPLYFISQVQDISARKEAEFQLQQAHQELTGRVDELTQRTREMALVGEMGERLQACRQSHEAMQVIAQSLQRLFPDEAGALSLLNPSQDRVVVMMNWGGEDSRSVVKDLYFAPDECWALRWGHHHAVENTRNDLLCAHTAPQLQHGYLCLPLTAERKTLGVLHLCCKQGQRWSEARIQLARTSAEQICLALFNLELQATLREQSVSDPLTGLFNRRYMEESLTRELARAQRKQHPVSLILLDVDHFKRFNDTFGHAAGDLVLREISVLLKENSRQMDTIACRYGGEEFILILPECSLKDAVQRAEDLRMAVKNLVLRHQERSLGEVTLSLGVAAYPEQGTTSDELLRNADALLYQAKREGRNRIMSPEAIILQAVTAQDDIDNLPH
jgi:diguanylate cyclase (GGDEF)-like protein/PAS domain S-box-containing protein